MKAGRS